MRCSSCQEDKKIVAKGLCGGCYGRLRRTGSIKRTYVVNVGVCAECGEKSFAKNLCALHYARQQHPLKSVWRNLRSRCGAGGFPPTWERFEQFFADVGERPDAKCKLLRKDPTKPHSKSNSFWNVPVKNEREDYYTPEERALYVRDWTLKRKFGIGSVDYAKIKTVQGGVCAICRCDEVFINKKTGVLQELSVDHDHKTGVVRGLLCVRCNRMLGYARDDAAILLRAIAYLG